MCTQDIIPRRHRAVVQGRNVEGDHRRGAEPGRTRGKIAGARQEVPGCIRSTSCCGAIGQPANPAGKRLACSHTGNVPDDDAIPENELVRPPATLRCEARASSSLPGGTMGGAVNPGMGLSADVAMKPGALTRCPRPH